MEVRKHLEKNSINQREEELSQQLELFKNTLGYKQLTLNEKKLTREILEKLSEYMFAIYDKKGVFEWETSEIKEILLKIFPEVLLANNTFFESIYIVCKKFFEFLYFEISFIKSKDWLFMLSDIRLKIVDNYYKVMNKNPNEQLFLDLGQEMGLNMSSLEDVSKLYKIYDLFIGSQKKNNFKII